MTELNDFKFNIQKAEDLANSEMISPILSATHYFCKKSGVNFTDIDQITKCFIKDKKTVLCLCAMSDRYDMTPQHLQSGGVFEDFETFIFFSKESGDFSFVGYMNREDILSLPAEMSPAGTIQTKIFYHAMKPLTDLWKIESEEAVIERDEIQPFAHLHLHTEFSVGDGYGSAEMVADEMWRKGFNACAITDHGTLAGTYYLQKTLKAKGLKPIIGYEAYVCNFKDDKDSGHITILCKNETGWKNLLKLHNKGVYENFYYKPRILLKDLIENSEGLIILSGCISGYVAKKILAGEAPENVLPVFMNTFKEDFYIEIMPHNEIPEQIKLNKILVDYAKQNNLNVVITCDAHYPNKEDKEVHEAIKAISYNKKYGTAGFTGNTYYYMQQQDIKEIMKTYFSIEETEVDSMFKNSLDIVEKCNFEISKLGYETLPQLFENEEETLTKLAEEKMKEFGFAGNPIYEARLKEELERILTKKYTRYFLIVHDYVNFCKEKKIQLGAGRGSVGGSLLAFILGITLVDPIKFNLNFTRFLSPARKDAPDIDLDFQDNRRQEVLDYFKQKYGENCTAKIGTYSTWHGKGALRDIGRIFETPIPETNKICSLVVQRSGGDARADFCLTDTFTEFEEGKKFKEKYTKPCEIAVKLESKIRHKGAHAAGIIISGVNLSELVPIMKVGDEYCTEWEKSPIEEIGLVKFDILGLSTLTIIKETLDKINPRPILPMEFEDKKVYDTVFKNGKTLGVFQFETVGLQNLSKRLEIDNFKLVYDATTLYRPGALHSGETADYVLRRHKKKEWTYDHPLLESITKDTYGLILYQEQVMQVMYDLGKFSWATSESTRKIMTKSKGKKEFEKLREDFCANANKYHNLSLEEAGRIFDVVSTFGSYGFNKSHAVEYSVISYWCAWLKTYYPAEFFATILSHEKESQSIKDYVTDIKEFGISVDLPEINKSKIGYYCEENKIYSGIDSIKGTGEKTAIKIIEGQPYESIQDFFNKVKPSERLFKALLFSGCFRNFEKNTKLLEEQYSNLKKNKGITNPLIDTEDYSEKELQLERLKYISLETGKPLIEMYEDPFLEKVSYTKIGELNFDDYSDEIWIKGIITFINFKQEGLEGQWTMFQNILERRYAHLNLADGTGNVLVHLSPEQYTFYKNTLERGVGTPVIIKGHSIKDLTKIYCDALIVLDDINQELPIVKYLTGQANKKLEEYRKINNCDSGIIKTVSYKVSKNKNPYARIKLYDCQEDYLCFQLTSKLFTAGECLLFTAETKPFIKILGRY